MKCLIYFAWTALGFLSATSLFLVKENQLEFNDMDWGLVQTPDTLFDSDGKLRVKRVPNLVNYELSSPYSQLNVLESGGDAKGEDERNDGWFVSILNDSKPPAQDKELGLLAIYEDSNQDGPVDDLMLLVGKPTYQRIVQINSTMEESEHLKKAFTIGRADKKFTMYYDWDLDGAVDLFTESQDKTIIAQWMIWDYKMYRVSNHVDKENRIYEVETSPGTLETVQWSETGWAQVAG
jgi:hypothetical protein